MKKVLLLNLVVFSLFLSNLSAQNIPAGGGDCNTGQLRKWYYKNQNNNKLSDSLFIPPWYGNNKLLDTITASIPLKKSTYTAILT